MSVLRLRSSGLIYVRDFIVILGQKETKQPVKAKFSQPFIINVLISLGNSFIIDIQIRSHFPKCRTDLNNLWLN